MKSDEDKVKQCLGSRGFICERFSKQETRKHKTPDFCVFRESEFVFFLEVKSSQDRWLDDKLKEAPPGTIVGGLRNDPIFNRLTDDIYSAVKQFDAVNPDQKWPNVLALVNHDDKCGIFDLIAILTGNFYAESGEVYPIYKQYSEGRIKDEKAKIHLFLWVEDFKIKNLFFTQSNNVLHLRLCALFGIDPKSIKQIPTY